MACKRSNFPVAAYSKVSKEYTTSAVKKTRYGPNKDVVLRTTERVHTSKQVTRAADAVVDYEIDDWVAPKNTQEEGDNITVASKKAGEKGGSITLPIRTSKKGIPSVAKVTKPSVWTRSVSPVAEPRKTLPKALRVSLAHWPLPQGYEIRGERIYRYVGGRIRDIYRKMDTAEMVKEVMAIHGRTARPVRR